MQKEKPRNADQAQTAETPSSTTLIICQLCKGYLPAGTTPNEHLDKAHPDLFKVETFLTNRNLRL